MNDSSRVANGARVGLAYPKCSTKGNDYYLGAVQEQRGSFPALEVWPLPLSANLRHSYILQ